MLDHHSIIYFQESKVYFLSILKFQPFQINRVYRFQTAVCKTNSFFCSVFFENALVSVPEINYREMLEALLVGRAVRFWAMACSDLWVAGEKGGMEENPTMT